MKKRMEEPGEQRIHLKESTDEAVVFQKKEKKREKKWSMVTLLFLIYAAVFFLSLFFLVEHSAGAIWQFSPAYVMKIARQNIQNFYEFVIGNGTPGSIDLQILRYLIVGLVGASLAACGALLQGTFRNVLAGPSTLGVQSGGTLGNMIYVLFFMGTSTSVVTIYRYDDIASTAEQASFFSRNIQQLFWGDASAVCFWYLAWRLSQAEEKYLPVP